MTFKIALVLSFVVCSAATTPYGIRAQTADPESSLTEYSARKVTGEMTAAGNQFVGSLFLTAFKDRVLIWRRNSDEPVVEVGQGGSTREVPIPKLKGYVFVDLITSNDRWVAHFRSEDTRPNDVSNRENFVYVDLRPQDRSISSRLTETGIVPFELACEDEGKYIGFIYDKDNNLMLLIGE